MIRNEVVTAFVGGTQVYPDNIKITCGVGRGYNSCSFSGLSTNVSGNVGDTVVVTLNGDTYTFLLIEKSYSEKSKIAFECKGIPYILENQSPSDDLLEYTNSDDLIEAESGSVVVVNNLPTIEFNGQSYSKANTPFGRISDMVSVVGGEAFEYNSSLYLEELKSISASPTIAHDFDSEVVFSYAFSDRASQSALLNQVLINPITDSIYATPSINVEYDEDTRKAEVFFSPSLTSENNYSFLGMKPNTPSMTTKVETILVDSETQIQTLGGIDTINYITLDGEPFTDYVKYSPYNIVRFTSVVSGEIKISYKTKSIVAYVNATTNFLIKYLCVKSEGTIEIDDTTTVSSQNCKVDIQTPFTYENGGSVKCYESNNVTLVFAEKKGYTNVDTVQTLTRSDGGTLTVKYTNNGVAWGDTTFMSNITYSIASEIETVSGTVEYDEELDVYKIDLPMKINSINNILEGSVGFNGYSYVDGDTPYISFISTDEGRSAEISVNVNVVTITIPPPTQGHVARFMDAVGCSGVATVEIINEDDALCSIPSTFRVEVADLLNRSISFCYGKTVVGDNGLGNLVVDEYGKVQVSITASQLYTITCDSIMANAKIYIDARGVTGA